MGQLGVGRTGKTAVLDIELRRSGSRTIISRQYSEVPLQVQRALYPDAGLPGMAHVYVLSPSGGLLQGDRYKTSISLKDKAAAHVTTQGASRIYGMNSNCAIHKMDISAGKGCYLEYIPDQVIPYAKSRYFQEVRLAIDDDAAAVYSEVVTPGRVAMGESFLYDILCTSVRCENQDGSLRFAENARAEPRRMNLRGEAVLGGYSVHGTVYVMAPPESARTIEYTAGRIISHTDGILGGTSLLPGGAGITARLLSHRTDSIFKCIEGIAGACRMEMTGAAYPGIRKC
ncbi:urease accessory protein [Cenarchaeum symbiosum A]|uniref:Urease accessory protein UreD n=1 Tax=Cenarchaeum symbiosum (strain A) TaxID=414004 RepID=URED_CENSY|nr:RecName: Full=Urease accessory protein UreD [Cenarchaeum symbiosum A]ABK77084.1 urease accessory protein [Cenarchaeum symbiosum A]